MQKFYNIRHGKSNLCRLLSSGQIETQHTLLVVQVCSTYNIYVGYLACTFSPGYLLPSLWYNYTPYIYVKLIFGCSFYLGTFYPSYTFTSLGTSMLCTYCVRDGLQSSCRVHLYFLLLFHPRKRRTPIIFIGLAFCKSANITILYTHFRHGHGHCQCLGLELPGSA